MQEKLEEKAKTELKQESHLTNCEDCNCLIHIDVYNLHKKDEICKNRGVCGTCWKGYYDDYIKNKNKK